MANEGEKVLSESLLKRPRLNEDNSLSDSSRPKMQRTHLPNCTSTEIGKIEDKTMETLNSSTFCNPLTDSSNYDIESKVHEDRTADECDDEEDAEASLGENSYDSDSVSEISDLSGLSEEAWKPVAGPLSWVQRQMALGNNPRIILSELVSSDTVIPHDLDDFTLWKIVINLICEPAPRKKLQHINTMDDVVHLLKTCSRVMVLTGAGVSVSCGIPDFRSRNGIYARLNIDFPDLPDPQAMFDIKYFQNDPRPFFKFAREIYPGQFEPSRSHKFIRLIEQHGKLLRNYTQNIDTLEQVAGISNNIQCHGSFATATCMSCKYKTDADSIRKDIFNQVIPRCPNCPSDNPLAVLKPDIVFFGESLSDEFHQQMAKDKDVCDLLIVIGSSLKVRPVALIPNSLPADVPQVLINREHLEHMKFDVELLGNCDEIVCELCRRLGHGWEVPGYDAPRLTEIQYCQLDLLSPTTVATSPCFSDESGILTSEPVPCDLNDNKTPSCQLNSSAEHITEPVPDVDSSCKPARTDARSCQSSDSVLKCHSTCARRRRHSSHSTVMENDDTCYSRDKSLDERRRIWSSSERYSLARRLKGKHSTRCNDRIWSSSERYSVDRRLKDDQYLFLPPNRYIFHGAEFFSDPESSESDMDLTADTSPELSLSLETSARCEAQEAQDSGDRVGESHVVMTTHTDSACVAPLSTVGDSSKTCDVVKSDCSRESKSNINVKVG
ncbi:NAD-dependent protein deacetylase sirtuin-1-like isoform X2 [Gigantopelta aegis]|uniref:NAD-dependent protein deacetylase sirtuin-1-like isoform X2 n=1 Tax=Gigantopelta aegis TaxID=1735272 RepID=UPI001B88A3D8|nr:NAD-dependent protein deacetylase sirtuin-1-like isoform X2 [Gigantopelta aegis]